MDGVNVRAVVLSMMAEIGFVFTSVTAFIAFFSITRRSQGSIQLSYIGIDRLLAMFCSS
jgi:hypothetical protein